MGGVASDAGAPRAVALLMLGVGALMLVGIPVLVATVDRPLVLYILGLLLVIVITCSLPLFVLVRKDIRGKRVEERGR